MSNRRNFLKILGGGTILAATGAGAFVATRTPHAALAPWQPQTYTDPRKTALSYAILAPNPHNRQPWLVELIESDRVVIHRDETRDLPETDPFHRQIFIGLGAFLETLVIAASAQGYNADLTILPNGDNGPVAEAVFSNGASPDPLAAQILSRHSTKSPYQARAISDAHKSALAGMADFYYDADQVQPIIDMTKRAFEIEVLTPHTYKESVDLMRIGKSEINANPDGIEMREPFFEILRRAGYMDAKMLMDTNHFGFQGYLASYLDMLDATPHFAVLTTKTNTRLDQLETGRRLMRLYLKTTELGVGLHPVSQALQEYPEMANEYTLAHELLAPQGHTVQMLLRLGYGDGAIATPRWPLETRIING